MAKRELPKISLADCGRRVLDAAEKGMHLAQAVRTVVDFAASGEWTDAQIRKAALTLHEPLDAFYSALLGEYYSALLGE